MARPLLADIELPQVQQIEVEQDQRLVQHSVPALEGDFLQRLNRRATRITLRGVLTGPEAGEQIKTLRDTFRAAEPVTFVADIATATQIGRVLIDELAVRELAGKPERYEYALTLQEYMPGTPVAAERPSPVRAGPSAAPGVDEEIAAAAADKQQETETQIDQRQGSLEVIIEAVDPSRTDFTQMQIRVEGETEAGESLNILLTEQQDGIFRKTDMPAGTYTVTLQMRV